jgi:hypothetical protein
MWRARWFNDGGIRVPGGLDGKAIDFTRLSVTRVDLIARVVRQGRHRATAARAGSSIPISSSRPPGRFEVVQTYTISR